MGIHWYWDVLTKFLTWMVTFWKIYICGGSISSSINRLFFISDLQWLSLGSFIDLLFRFLQLLCTLYYLGPTNSLKMSSRAQLHQVHDWFDKWLLYCTHLVHLPSMYVFICPICASELVLIMVLQSIFLLQSWLIFYF